MPPRPTTPRHVHWAGLTHPGRVRTNNEDTFLALAFDGHTAHYLGKTGDAPLAPTDFVFAVSDGMGGARSGEFASRITADRITKLLPRSFKHSALGLNSGFQDILNELLASIHADLHQLGRSYEECAGMGATLTLAWLTPEWLFYAHIGDSRLYYLPKTGGLKQLTHDHTQVGWMLRHGELNERQLREHPARHGLLQVLGGGTQFIDPQFGAVAHQPGDKFLLCTDGLIDGLWDHAIEDLLREPHSTQPNNNSAQRLVEESLANSGRDNTTAITLELTTPADATTPATPTEHLLFVYGTLKRGCSNHPLLSDQTFLAPARTAPGYTLYELDGYPGLVANAADTQGVLGELWSVTPAALARLDQLEGVPENLYRRIPAPLAPPHENMGAEMYLYNQDITTRRPLGPEWRE